MPRLAQSRDGKRLRVSKRETPFTFWPTKREGRGRAGLQTKVFTNDPWSVIRSSINKNAPSQDRKRDAIYFFNQAKDYYSAVNHSNIVASKPVLTYYCLMNTIKSFVLTFGNLTSLDQARHGISESNAGTPNFQNHSLTAYPSTANSINIFDKFYELIVGSSLSNNLVLPINELLPQVIMGHRMWCTALKRKERFIPLDNIHYYANENNEVWLRIYVNKHDLSRLSITHSNYLEETRLTGKFRQVTHDDVDTLCFESINTMTHGGWPSDKLHDLSFSIKPHLWQVLLSANPYKKFYTYTAPNNEIVLPQLLSIYALVYYYGSVTRYRPRQFQNIIDSNHGGYVSEFINNQVLQFLYLISAEFAKRDVIKPAVI
ncbi:MAG: YaaC family protein [Candidatus Paceibacterota bacterium]